MCCRVSIKFFSLESTSGLSKVVSSASASLLQEHMQIGFHCSACNFKWLRIEERSSVS